MYAGNQSVPSQPREKSEGFGRQYKSKTGVATSLCCNSLVVEAALQQIPKTTPQRQTYSSNNGVTLSFEMRCFRQWFPLH